MSSRVSGTGFAEAIPLFQVSGARTEWGVTPDGERFLFALPAAGRNHPFTVVLNWMAGLK